MCQLHWISLLVVSVVIGPLLAAQNWLMKIGVLSIPITSPAPWSVAIACTLLLTGLAWWGWKSHQQHRVHLAAFLSAVWMAVTMTLFFHGYAKRSKCSHAIVAEARRVEKAIGSGTVGYLDTPPTRLQGLHDNEEFLFYLRRIIRPFESHQLSDADTAPEFIMAEDTDDHDRMMRQVPYARVLKFKSDYIAPRWLYVRATSAETAASGFAE